MKTINLLWTGGWDSTYRILQLFKKEVIIQPYYLLDNRKSEEQELQAISTITELIKAHPETNCILKELITAKVADIPKDAEITTSFKNLLKTDFFGSQYDWLARFSKNIHNLELTIHEDDKACVIINKHGGVHKKNSDLKGTYFELDTAVSSADLINVFGNYHFPLLKITKLEMKKYAEDSGLMDIMNTTWFCHNPVDNQPCGKCNPCLYTIEEGLLYRFSKKTIFKHKKKKLKAFFKNKLKIKG